MFNITLNTFREIVRNKFLYMILFFAFAFIAFSISLWTLTIWDDDKIIVDFWLAMIEIFWLIWVLFVWSQLLFKEIDWKTIFLILSKPIKRYEFIIWKFLGFSCTIFVILIFQSFLFLLILFVKNIQITELIAYSLFFTFLKLEILLSLVFFFSTFMSNILTILVSLIIYFLWHSFSLLLDLVARFKNEVYTFLVRLLELFFPPMNALNTKDVIWSFDSFSNMYFLSNTFYAFFYILILLIFTIFIFNRKRFEN